jgi:hypothetical protein
MGEIVVLERGTAGNLFSRSNVIPGTITISIGQARMIERDLRRLDAVMTRARDARALSMIVSTICGVNSGPAERAARAIGLWLRAGDDSWRIWAGLQ